MDEATHPPLQLLVDIVDRGARTTPNDEWISVSRTSDPRDGWRPITWARAANAVNRLAHELVEVLGSDRVPPQQGFPTIGYIGPNDPRYYVMMLGAVKAGCQALFISPRNSLEGQLNLFDKTECQVLFLDAAYERLAQPWLQARPGIRAIVVDDLEQWFPNNAVPAFPYAKTFVEAEWDPLVVLHTSGSTGLPKPVVVRQGMLANAGRLLELPLWQGNMTCLQAMSQRSKKMLCPMPLFHAGGLYLSLMLRHYGNQKVALAPGSRPLSMDLLLQCFEYCDCESALMPTSLLEEMSQIPETMEPLRKLDHVVNVGGGLGGEAGNRLVEYGVHLCNFISSTEFAPYPLYWQPNPRLWPYFLYNSEQMGIDWRKASDDDDTYEQVIVRKAEHPGLQGCFYTFPELTEWNTKDLYRRHPTEPNNWIYNGRADNILVFSNGEKLNPITIEDMVADHPRLKGALVVGSNRFQPGLLLEPVEPPATAEAAQDLIDAVWPLVVEANKVTVAHGQIGREFIALSNPSKPFARAGKGTIQRAATVKLYESEIDTLYERAGSTAGETATPLDVSSSVALARSICTVFSKQFRAPDLKPDSDFFSAAGVDSLQVIKASRLLRAGLEIAGVHVDGTTLSPRAIYGHPTASRIASYLHSVVIQKSSGTGGGDGSGSSGLSASSQEAHHQRELASMETLLNKYTRDFASDADAAADKTVKPPPADDGQVVVITGTTGGLGSYLLEQAVASPRVRRVVALNRAADGRARQALVNAERGLRTDLAKVDFYCADLAQPNLGLDGAVYAALLHDLDRIIHNAWPVNFSMAVESFEPLIAGVVHLVDMSARAVKRVPIIFVSSIGTVDVWPYAEPVPEASIRNLSLAGTGYGRSKLLASLVLEKATAATGVPSAMVRVGQVAGPTTRAGYWNRKEWLPTLVASSLHLGVLPADLGAAMSTVDWTPVEAVATLLLEVAGVVGSTPVPLDAIDGYFHGVNPRTTTWAALVPAVQRFYGPERITGLVPLRDWVARLEASAASATAEADVQGGKNPGVKLLDTYRGFLASTRPVVFDMTRTMARSGMMRAMEAVTPTLMENWCRQWGF